MSCRGWVPLADIAEFAHGDHGGDDFESFKGHERLDDWLEVPVLKFTPHVLLNACYTIDAIGDGGKVFLKDRFLRRTGHGEFAQVVHMGFVPRGLAFVCVTVPA
jgi:hypothetical protein